MTNKKDGPEQSGRRELIKKTAIAGVATAAVTKWQKPMVDAVLLPAHAQSSVPTTTTPPPATLAVMFNVASDDISLTVDAVQGGSATLTSSDIGDGIVYAVGIQVTPAAATAINITYDNQDDLDTGPASGSDVMTNAGGVIAIPMSTDDLPDNSGSDAIQTFTFTPANGAGSVSITLDFS